MTIPLSVATTINPRFDHVTPIEATRSDVTISHRCHVFAELLAVARSGLVDIVLVADDLQMLGLETLEQIKDTAGEGPAVAAITDVVDDRKRLIELGIPAVSPQLSGPDLVSWLQQVAQQPAEELSETEVTLTPDELQVLEDLDPQLDAAQRTSQRAVPNDSAGDLPTGQVPRTTRASAEPQATAGSEADLPQPPVSDTPDRQGLDETTMVHGTQESEAGQVVAVWGPIGSPGVTTLAVNVAAESALAGHRTLLIDADTYGAAVAVHFGLLDDTAAIAQACRSAEHRGLDVADLTSHTQRVQFQGATVDVLTGLTRAERWPQLRAAAWSHVLDVARQGWEVIVVDCGFGLEEDEELSFDIPAPQRNATTLTAIHAADVVVAVGTGDPVGFVRYMRGLEQLTALTEGRIIPVINKVTSMTSGLSPKRQLRGVWDRFGPNLALQQFIRWAPDVAAAALLRGKTLAESAPKAELRLAIQRLAQAVVPQPSVS